ncbi:MAG: hypothetical protein GY931_16550 [Maribacter sp.]|nr:hypothetical protein [Maribacter sp.]
MLDKLTYKTIYLVSIPKIHTDLLWDLTMLFIVLAIIIISTVFYFKRKLTVNSRKTLEKKKELSPMISEFIFYSKDASKKEKHIYIEHKILIRELLKNDFDRKVLTSILLDLRKDVTGESQRQLINLYKNLGLHKDAYKKLKSWRWAVVAKGIMELTQMQVTESYQLIVGFINNRRSVVRKEAEIAAINLKGEGISYFMDTTRYRISEWQQLVILEVIRNNKEFVPPLFKVWLTSGNKDVVLLALRFIKHFNQNDAKASLIELLKHRNNQIKEEAINCLKEFHVVEALDTLKLVFWRCSTNIKILIIGAIAELGDIQEIEFLKQIEHKRLHFSVKNKALNAINSIAPESVMPIKGIESTESIIVPEDEIKEINEKDTNEDLASEIKEATEELTKEERVAEIKNVMEEDKVEENVKEIKEVIAADINEEKAAELREVKEEDEIEEKAAELLETIEEDINEEEVAEIEINQYEEITHEEKEIEPFIVDFKSVADVWEENPDTKNLNVEYDLIDFLPIVVSEDIKSDENELNVDLLDVIYDEIKPPMKSGKEVEAEEIEETTLDLNIEDLSFLPIVVDSDYENVLIGEEEQFQKTLLEFDLEYEEVSGQQEKMVIEEILEGNENETESRLQEIATIEVIYEELMGDEKTASNEENSNSWPLTEDNETLEEETGEESELASIISIIPKPYEFDDEAVELHRLLSDIEEFGDHREIPFLTNLLLDETRPLIRERIRDVIYGIERVINSENDAIGYNVFEELFKSCDLESKLILMDEMVSIGDEKEVSLLTRLTNDSNIEISSKAKSVLTKLKERHSIEAPGENQAESLDLTKSEEGNSKQQNKWDDLLTFTDEFKLEHRINAEKNNKTQGLSNIEMNNALLSKLMSLPNKLFEKLNG